MKKKQITELSKKSLEELYKEATATREHVKKLEFTRLSGEQTNTREKFHQRHHLARVLGIIQIREGAQSVETKEESKKTEKN